MTSDAIEHGNTWGQRQNVWGIYVQDDWRVNRSLTLNLACGGITARRG